MKIFTNDGLRRIGDRTVEKEGIEMLDLIERAASAVSYELISRWRTSKRFVFFAGPGDNGADALAVARMMYEQGYRPEVYLFNIKSAQLSPCCLANRDRLLQTVGDDIDFIEVIQNFNPPELTENDVVVDGLFGNGLRTPLKGGYTALVQYINSSDAYVVSIDIPSGMFGEWNMGNDRRNIIRADLTLTYQSKRLAFYFAENADCVGECKVLDIELDRESVARMPTDFYLIEREDVHDVMRPRNPFSNKYDHGTLLLIAGSYGMMGAAVMSARGALRAGAGLVTVHAPRCGYQVLQTAVPEALFEPDRNEIMTTAIDLHHTYSVVALGPGIGTNDETLEAVHQFIMNFKRPCLLDADALNCIARRPSLLRSIPPRSIITPHAIEFDRLFGDHNTDEERLKKALDVSKIYNITIVLKGHYTMTVRPDSKIYVNSSGNAGMATPGSGDVLTGVIGALIAQNYPADWSVVLGVYLHGLAGDLAAQEHGTYGMIASDIVDRLGKAIVEVMK
ncbi:MAG: NAD(P)H-hydrate dehydratase [Muribaculaceae bacterium]|nr:NAD(P)H-hydrate dehydratase [Muribaculaceae bacterium]